MTEVSTPTFDSPDLHASLAALTDEAIDRLQFGVIGIDAELVARRYNAWESRMAGLAVDRVVGKSFFTLIGVCMNNFMVAQRFVDAQQAGTVLDATIDYVLTFRMRPVKVKLRLLAMPSQALSYIAVNWS